MASRGGADWASGLVLRDGLDLPCPALARLRDRDARQALVDRLLDDQLGVRFNALQDCVYVQDPTIAAHFGPALADLRDVVTLTIPEEQPTVVARIADVAAMVMANLGHQLSYPAEVLTRFSNAQLEEARKVVAGLEGD